MENVKRLVVLLLFVFIFLRYLYPVFYGRDTDIFWHLKTGEIIFNEQRIPDSDPFTYTPPDPVREKVLLRSYWLSDLIFFILYKIWGLTGLVVMRSMIICLTIFLVYRSLIKKGFFISVLLSLMLGFALMPMSAVRPNLFSFLFATAMISLMEKYREEQKKRFQISLFIVMLLWANMHGGHIIGTGILTIYIFSEILTLLPPFKKEGNYKRSVSTCLTGGIGIAATFINPLGITLFHTLSNRFFNPANKLLNAHIETETGFLKILKQYPDGMIFLSVVVAGFILIYAALNLTRKKAGVAETAIISALLILSVNSIRVLPVFLTAGLILSAGKGKYNISSINMNNKINMILSFFLISIMGFFIFQGIPKINPGRLIETDTIYLRMGDFLEHNKINGNMLNREFTGNFIIFRLFPEYRVFTDSRYINVEVFFDGLDMFHAVKEPAEQKDIHYNRNLAETCINILKGENKKDYTNEYWYALLEKYDIDFIVGRISHPRSGMLFPIFLKLIHDDRWKLIYMDGNAVVMIKDNQKNETIIKNFTPMSKTLLYDQAIYENINKDSASAYETLAFAFLMKGDKKNAGIFAKNALIMNKNLRIAKACLQSINNL